STNSNGSFIEPNLMEVDENYESDKTRSKITHIANGGKFTVYAMVEKDKQYLKNVTSKFFEDAEKLNWQMPETFSFYPFTRIRAGAFEGFNSGAANKVYITIFSHDILTGKIEKIADAYKVKSGSGVVIGFDNKIHDVENGKLWIDSTGKNHSRRPQNV
uniref:Uncharacterized protein n=1 Tax=Panagrolaimus sp. PS1159 TaxID=55785 RepID=A0AC35GFA6_9BILA